jgi:plasmid stabilization system protein ParE
MELPQLENGNLFRMKRAKTLPVIISPTAEHELWRIYDYNLERRGQKPADSYDVFLANRIQKLATNYPLAKAVEDKPGLFYALAQRRSKSDGHVIVFSIGNAIDVLHVFHTKQDWPSKL